MTAADPGRVHTEGRLARAVVEDARDARGRAVRDPAPTGGLHLGRDRSGERGRLGGDAGPPGQPVLAGRGRAFECRGTRRERLAPVRAAGGRSAPAGSTRPRWPRPSSAPSAGGADPGPRPLPGGQPRSGDRSSRWPRSSAHCPAARCGRPRGRLCLRRSSPAGLRRAGRRPPVGQRPQIGRPARGSAP